MVLPAATELLDGIKTVVFPLSAVVLLTVYPLAVLFFNIVEGQAAGHAGKANAPQRTQAKDDRGTEASKGKLAPQALRNRVRGLRIGSEVSDKTSSKVQLVGLRNLQALVILASGAVTLTGLANQAFASTPGVAGTHSTPPAPVAGGAEGALPAAGATTVAAVAVGGLSVACGAGLVGLVFALRYSFVGGNDSSGYRPRRGSSRSRGMSRTSSGVLRRCASNSEVLYTRCEASTGASVDAAQPVGWYAPPADEGPSLWHSVDLHVKSWLDESTGLYRYVNEIPRGALQKFELQTKLAKNIIREDAKGSRRLRAFGRPVPFNYGAFPQTYRDPDEIDDIHGAPGDDDPLDVLDLTQHSAGVGEVVCCRILGAVCLIDEGQADWKVIVVNTDAKDPLAEAQSVDDAERIAPGRIEEALKWIDDFKQYSSKSGTTLHFDVLDASKAIAIIEKDHSAWKRLGAEADSNGFARGHWIREARKLAKGTPQALPLAYTPRLGVPRQLGVPPPLTGISGPPGTSPGRELVMRRQTSANSDGGESSNSGMSVSTRLSTDSDICA